MKPLQVMGGYVTITKRGTFANVTDIVRSNTMPQKRARTRLAEAAYNSFGQPQDVLKMNVDTASAGPGSNGGMTADARRDLQHRMAGVRIQAMRAQISGAVGSRSLGLPSSGFSF